MERKSSPVADVERAMVAIRRRQRRRVLASQSGVDPAGAEAQTVLVLDAVEAIAECTVSTIAELLGVDQPRASRLVARAVDADLLERRSDQSDGRRSLLRLTGAGRGLLARVRRTRRAAMARAMRGWTEREQREFARLLTRFVEGLDAESRTSPKSAAQVSAAARMSPPR